MITDCLHETNCIVCNKLIIKRYNWLYKFRRKGGYDYCCSYTCYRKAGGDSGKWKASDIAGSRKRRK